VPGIAKAQNLRRGSGWSFPIVALLLVQATYAEIPCRAKQGPDATALCVSLRLKKGRFAIDREHTVLTPSAVFAGNRKLRPEAARVQILDDLDRLFQTLPPTVWFGFSTEEVDKETRGQMKDAPTTELRTFTGTWTDFLAAYRTWHALNLERKGEGDMLSAVVNTTDPDWGPLIFDPDAGPPSPVDAAAGVLRFTVADPIGDWRSADYVIQPPTDISRDDIIRVLEPLKGTLWRPSVIRSRLEGFLKTRGFHPAIEVQSAGNQPKAIKVHPGERIARILYSPPADNHADLDRALYLVLPDVAFRNYLAHRNTVLKAISGPPARLQVDLTDVGLSPGSEPLLNDLDLQFQKLELAPLGFNLNAIPSGVSRASDDHPYVDLLVEKQSDEKSSDSTRSAQPPVGASPEGIVQGGAQGSFTPSITPTAPKVSNAPPPKNLKNYIGGGFEYDPGQGVRPLVLFQRSQLFGTGGLSLQTGGANDNPLAFGNFILDFAGFGGLGHRRLTVQVTGLTDYTLNRQFFSNVRDERRTGGFVRLELELFRNLTGQQLKLNVEGRRATVELLSGGSSAKSNLTDVDFGAVYLLEQNTQAFPRRLRIETSLRRGLGIAAAEPAFTRFVTTANYHQQMLGPTEFDVTGSFGTASGSTPIFELPSFGGEQSVRGFRKDDVLGQRLWSVQPEVWTPVPSASGATQGVGSFVRQNVRLAFFSDFGGVYKTLGPLQGMKGGPGAGLRIYYGLIVLKFDWAKGFGDASTEAKWGRVYFNVATTRAF